MNLTIINPYLKIRYHYAHLLRNKKQPLAAKFCHFKLAKKSEKSRISPKAMSGDDYNLVNNMRLVGAIGLIVAKIITELDYNYRTRPEVEKLKEELRIEREKNKSDFERRHKKLSKDIDAS